MGKTRTVQDEKTMLQKILCTLLILAFGICLGLGSKALDQTAFNELPYVLQRIDIINFLGRFAIWIFIAVCISVFSGSPKRAALNVFVFFAGMVSCYYLYSALAAGFFPKSYAMIWFGITVVSPFLAVICWYAKGEGPIAVVISGVIIGILFSQALFLFQGVQITYIPEVIVWLASLWVLRRKPKEFAAVIGISVLVAVIWQLFVPYWG